MGTSRIAAPVTGLLAACALVACGDNLTVPMDGEGPPPPDAPADCRLETDEAGNDVTPEPTGLVLAAAGGGIRMCGTFAHDPPAGPDQYIDIDRYEITVEGTGAVLFRLVSAGANDFAIARISVHEGPPLDLLGAGRLFGGHAPALAVLDPGAYVIEVSARNPAMLAGAIPYEIRVNNDDPTRCVPPPAVSYTEATDGANNTGNDTGSVANDTFTLSGAPNDAPEPSAEELAIEPGFTYQADGVSGMHPAMAGYLDRDTYLVAAGPSTNQIDVVLSFPDTGMPIDMDWYLFDATVPAAPTFVQKSALVGSPEHQPAAVLPSTSYFLWVGNAAGSAQPHDYTIVLCGDQFVP
jgi:hypothetical protein